MQPSRLMCSRCGRPLVCAEDLARWLESVMRDGARVYCSLACSAVSEAEIREVLPRVEAALRSVVNAAA